MTEHFSVHDLSISCRTCFTFFAAGKKPCLKCCCFSLLSVFIVVVNSCCQEKKEKGRRKNWKIINKITDAVVEQNMNIFRVLVCCFM